jgi:predicted outer membrane protein
MARHTLAIAIATATILIAPTAFAAQSSIQSSAQSVNRADARFLKDFAQVNAAKVDTAQLAEWKAEDDRVKTFATQMVATHAQTIAKIAKIAAQTNIIVKAKPSFIQNTKSAILDISVGDSFDTAYMKGMINDAEKTIELLETEIRDGQDASIKHLALDSLTDARSNLKMVQDLRAQVSASQDVKRTLWRNGSGGGEKVAASH